MTLYSVTDRRLVEGKPGWQWVMVICGRSVELWTLWNDTIDITSQHSTEQNRTGHSTLDGNSSVEECMNVLLKQSIATGITILPAH